MGGHFRRYRRREGDLRAEQPAPVLAGDVTGVHFEP